jgi:hypothetical protein
MKKILGLALGLTMISLTPALGNEAKKTPVTDHQTCIAEWAEEKAYHHKYSGQGDYARVTIRELKAEVQSLRKLVEALLTKIPDAKK